MHPREASTDDLKLHLEVHALRGEVSALSEQVRGLVEAWETAQGVVRFVRWSGRLAIAIAGIWGVIRLFAEQRKG